MFRHVIRRRATHGPGDVFTVSEAGKAWSALVFALLLLAVLVWAFLHSSNVTVPIP